MSIRVVERNCGDIARKILAISEATGKDKLNEAIGRGIVLPPLDERAHLMEQSALGGVGLVGGISPHKQCIDPVPSQAREVFPARVWACSGRWQPMLNVPFDCGYTPSNSGTGKHLAGFFPFFGDFHLHNRALAPRELELLGLRVTYTSSVECVEFPAWRSGSRAMIIPGRLLSPINFGGRGRILELPNTSNGRSHGVAFQFTGGGSCSYLSHFLGKKELLGYSRDFEYRGRSGNDYEIRDLTITGKSGIFMGIPYQPCGRSPIGGQTPQEARNHIEREGTLLSRGAALGGIKIGWIQIIDPASLKKVFGHIPYGCEEGLAITQRCYRFTTVRLDDFIEYPSDMKNKVPSKKLLSFLESLSWPQCKTPGDWLDICAETAGYNTGLCLDCRLVLPGNQNTVSNLTAFFEILDAENFIEMSKLTDAFALFGGWMRALRHAASIAGYDWETFRRSRQFTTFTDQLGYSKEDIDKHRRLAEFILDMMPIRMKEESIVDSIALSLIWTIRKIKEEPHDTLVRQLELEYKVRTEEAAGCKVDRSYTLRNHFTDSFDLTWYLSASSFLLSRMYKDEPLLKTYRE